MKNTQNIQISGSARASFGDINQTIQPASSGWTGDKALRPVRVLFMAANPSNTSRLRLDQEARAIDQALQTSGLRDRFELEHSWAVGDRDLQESLLRYQPDIVHLSGHGTRSGRVLLEPGSLGDNHPHPTAAAGPADDPMLPLARIFVAARGRIRCAVLNACHSEALARSLAEEIECVVGMSDAIEDEKAIRFSWSFYNALGYGQSVKAAFELAAAHVALKGPGSDHVLRLVALRCDPAAVVFLPGAELSTQQLREEEHVERGVLLRPPGD